MQESAKEEGFYWFWWWKKWGEKVGDSPQRSTLGFGINKMGRKGKVSSELPPYFGKYQRFVACLSFGVFQCMLYVSTLVTFYAVVTLNIPLILILAKIVFLQSFARRSQKYIDFVNNVLQIRKYLSSFQVIYEEHPSDKQPSLFGIHPHGVFSLGLSSNMNYGTGPLSRMVGLSSRFMLACPIVGLQLRLWGLEAVHGEHMKKLMGEGKNIGLLPGGFEEATITTGRELRVYIKSRKGFVKYAMENNYTIYPVLVLREHQAFWTFDHLKRFRLALNRLKMPSVWYFHPKTLLIYPFDMDLISIVGKGIHYPHYAAGQIPTQAEIDAVHGRYMQEMQRVYQKHAHLNDNLPLIFY